MSSISIVGRGRLGTALSAALRAAGRPVEGPLGRGAEARDATVVLLCVPDAEIAAAAQALGAPVAGRLVGHCSGATTLDVLHPHEAFSLHPLMTVPDASATLAGAGCASPRPPPPGWRPPTTSPARSACAPTRSPRPTAPPTTRPRRWPRTSSSPWRAPPSASSRPRAPTARCSSPSSAPSVESWAEHGAARALTGPIARGDEETVTRQRAAVERRTPELLGLFDALADATRDLVKAPA